MPLPPGTLRQALDQLPQFLLALGEMQERRKYNEQRARQANLQETAKMEAFELELVRMGGQADNPDVAAATIPGLRRSIKTPKGLRALDVFADLTIERQIQQRRLEKEQILKDQAEKTFREQLDIMSEEAVIRETSRAGLSERERKLALQEAAERKGIRGLKEPSGSDVAYARMRRRELQEDINEANNKIALMRQKWKLDPGETPKKKNDIANWNKAHLDLAMAQMSFDNLLKGSAERGIDLEFGAPALPPPGQLEGMSDEEVLRMIQGAGVR